MQSNYKVLCIVCVSLVLLFVSLPVTVLLPSPFRFSASRRQGAELDWEEVQGTEPHQHLCPPTALTGTAFSSNDFLGEHSPRGPGPLCASFPQPTPTGHSQDRGTGQPGARVLLLACVLWGWVGLGWVGGWSAGRKPEASGSLLGRTTLPWLCHLDTLCVLKAFA